jgi:Flp pilus assembly protein TadD
MRRTVAIGLGLAIAVLAVYAPVRGYEFVNYDDPGDTFLDSHVAGGLTWANVTWAITSTERCNWIPLTRLSHMAVCQVFGPTVAGAHHAVNVVLHVASTLLLFLVLRRMTRAEWPSAVVAALFGLHPLHVESVAWVAERKDVLSTLFWMLTLWAYVRYAERPSVARYVPVFVLLALGLAAKPMLVTMPCIMLLLDFWPLKRFGYSTGEVGRAAPTARCSSAAAQHRTTGLRLVLEKLPLFLLVAASSVVAFIAQSRGGAMEFASQLPLSTRVAGALTAYVGYLGKAFWPSGLTFFYPYVAHPAWEVAAAAAALIGVTALVIWQGRRRPYLAVGWFWYLGTLVPVIGFVQIGAHAMADRYTYVPLIGIFVAVAWAAADLLSGWRHRLKVLVPAAAAVVAACAVLTYFQVQTWASTEALCLHAIKVLPGNALAHSNLGLHLSTHGRFAEALPHLEEVLRLEPRFKTVHTDLGVTLGALGRFNEAIAHFREALRQDPNDVVALANLGALLSETAAHGEERDLYRRALALEPDNTNALNNIGVMLSDEGRLDDAMACFRKVLALEPSNALAHSNLGLSLARAGRGAEAVAGYQEALHLRPDWPDALNRLARLRATFDDPRFRGGDEAVTLATRACRLTGGNRADFLDTLAAAYAEVGRFADAVAAAEAARTRAESQGRKDLAAQIQSRGQLYRDGRPYREPLLKPGQAHP